MHVFGLLMNDILPGKKFFILAAQTTQCQFSNDKDEKTHGGRLTEFFLCSSHVRILIELPNEIFALIFLILRLPYTKVQCC